METLHFAGLFQPDDDLDRAQVSNNNQARRRAAFDLEINKVIDGKKPGEIKDALRKWVFNERGLEIFQTHELMRILTTFRADRAFHDIIRLVDECKDQNFTQAQLVNEYYVSACNHTRQYDKALEKGEDMLGKQNFPASAAIYGSFGKAWYQKYLICKKYLDTKDDPDIDEGLKNSIVKYYKDNFPDDRHVRKAENNLHVCLAHAKDNYSYAFLKGFEYHSGMRAAHCMLEMRELEEAYDISRMVMLACLRDGVRHRKDHWCTGAYIEAACISDAPVEDIRIAIDDFFKRADNDPKIIERLIARMSESREICHNNDWQSPHFNMALGMIYQKMGSTRIPDSEVTVSNPINAVTTAILESSYSYRGLTSHFVGADFIPGNFKHGGQLPDHCLTRADWQQFENLMEAPLDRLLDKEDAAQYPATLSMVKDVDTFLEVTDKLLRRAFGTEEQQLEILHGICHLQYDQKVQALLTLSGIEDRQSADSRTNISVIMGLGLGDCRHHAQAKQLLFDVWQKKQMSNCMRHAYNGLQGNNSDIFGEGVKAFFDVELVELRTFDVVVQAPVQMDSLYNPKMNSKFENLATEDGSMQDVEEHTLNILLHRDKNGNVRSLRFADSFYQNKYQWGDGDIDVSNLILDENNRIVIPAKMMEAHDDKIGKSVQQPVQLVPTSYAGARSEIPKDEIGKLLLLGTPIRDGFDLTKTLETPFSERTTAMERLRKWNAPIKFGPGNNAPIQPSPQPNK